MALQTASSDVPDARILMKISHNESFHPWLQKLSLTVTEVSVNITHTTCMLWKIYKLKLCRLKINASFSIQYLGSTYLLIMPWTHTVFMAHIHRMQALVSMQFPWHYGFGLGLFSPIASPSSMTQDYRVHKPCPWPVAIQVLDSYKLCTIHA